MKCRPSMVATAYAPSGARQAELHHIRPFGAESRLAVAEVEAPQPPEALVEAQPLDLVPRPLEAPGPFGQGVGVVLAEADDVAPFQPGQRRLLLQPRLRGQHAAREDVLLDEIGPAAILGEELVADGDDLEAGAAAGREHVTHLVEVGR